MVKIIVAFSSGDQCALFASLLEEAGFAIYRQCTSGSEVRRAINQCHDGIVVCSTRLPDCTADELAWDLQDRAMMLVVGRPQQLELCEYPQLFRLSSPFSKGELTSALNMLTQFYQMKLPRRSPQEKQLIASAKEKLMQLEDMTEPEAHHVLQQLSMAKGIRLADAARSLLEKLS
ncbi:MAG: ANTAR domain-containing protein [Clostridia bacterium]|nr:ANTAR domain-containing protein [Clostridia bacterium]MDD6041535.1 ANTAR domain-containing protein [Clostridia bacterium]